ncbi:hypothetical protein [Azospirillum sp. Marseille-Q6669]
MTPQLQQAIKLLQLSNIELSDFVDREIEQNPCWSAMAASARAARGGDGGGERGRWTSPRRRSASRR